LRVQAGVRIAPLLIAAAVVVTLTACGQTNSTDKRAEASARSQFSGSLASAEEQAGRLASADLTFADDLARSADAVLETRAAYAEEQRKRRSGAECGFVEVAAGLVEVARGHVEVAKGGLEVRIRSVQDIADSLTATLSHATPVDDDHADQLAQLRAAADQRLATMRQAFKEALSKADANIAAANGVVDQAQELASQCTLKTEGQNRA